MRRVDKAEALLLLDRERAESPARFSGCAMCGLANGHPSDVEILAENAVAVAVLDRYGQRRGHTLVILRDHVESLADLPWQTYSEVQRLAWEAARALSRALGPKRIFVAALGSATRLPLSFPHHHVHVIPVFDGGEADKPAEVLSSKTGVLVYEPDEACQLAHAIRAAWRD